MLVSGGCRIVIGSGIAVAGAVRPLDVETLDSVFPREQFVVDVSGVVRIVAEEVVKKNLVEDIDILLRIAQLHSRFFLIFRDGSDHVGEIDRIRIVL